MSHQTGIKCNPELLEFITSVKKNDGPNIFSVKIDEEQLKLDSYASGDGVLRDDLENHLSQVYTPNEPSYIFVKYTVDSSISWILIFYSPDSCNTRKKMLYASTKSTLKNEFGSGNISLEYFATTLEEMLVKNIIQWYNEQMDEDLAPKHQWTRPDQEDNASALADHFSQAMPRLNSDFNKRNVEFLTPNEIEKLAVKAQSFQMTLEKNDSKNKGNMLKIKMDDDSRNALKNYAQKSINYVKLLFNIEKEQIELSATQNTQHKYYVRDKATVNQKILIESGNAVKGNTGFHLIRFDHNNPDDEHVSMNILILLVDPNYTKPRERMTYASFCASLVNELSDSFGVNIERRIEADDTNDVTLSYIAEKIYPQLSTVPVAQPEEEARKFSKPKGPPGRGPRRIIK